MRRGVAFNVVKKVLLAGCMLGVGMVAGAFLIGHQAFLEVINNLFETFIAISNGISDV